MKKVQIILITFFSLIFSSCQQLSVDILDYRINRAFDFIDKTFESSIDNDMNLPSEIPFDKQIIISYQSLSPNVLDSKGKVFLNTYNQKAMIRVTMKLKNIEQSRDYSLDVKSISRSFDNDLKIYFINVGQGDCILIILPNLKTILIDAGDGFYGTRSDSWDIINGFLTTMNVDEIDIFIATHNHYDHSRHIQDLINSYTVKQVYSSFDFSESYWEEIYTSKSTNKLELYYPLHGEYLINEPGLYLRVITNLKDVPSNSSSLTVWLKYLDFSVFFAADADSNITESIAINYGYYIESKLLKVGHHGIDDSTSLEFLSKILPQFGIITSLISSDKFPYPDQAIRNLYSYGVIIYETSKNNHIFVASDGFEWTISRMTQDYEIDDPIESRYYDTESS